MAERAKALVVTSSGAPGSAVMPVLAALEVRDLEVRAIDVGRAGSRDEGTVGRFVRAIAGEFAERRVEREVAESSPDVMLAFEPASVSALTELRDRQGGRSAVIAVVADLDPGIGWAGTNADRYLAVDDVAAVALSDKGLEGHRIMTVGPVVSHRFARAGASSRTSARKKFKLPATGSVVLVDVDGMGYDIASQVALQLSLVGKPATYLFDAGRDSDAATALRRQVPTLDLRAKLFGETADAPDLWRCADVCVVRPRQESISRALAVGARVVSFLPDDRAGEALAEAMAKRGVGATAAGALLLSSAIEPLLSSKSSADAGADGAANIADIAAVVAAHASEVVSDNRRSAHEPVRERVESAAEWAAQVETETRAPGELEDLSSPGAGAAAPDFDDGEIERLKGEVQARMTQVGQVISEAQKAADEWEKRRALAEKKGHADLARRAKRNMEADRARMHAALAEMAQLSNELEELSRVEQAPRPKSQASQSRTRRTTTKKKRESVDDLLAQMKRQAANGGGKSTSSKPKRKKKKKSGSGVDDELAALKRKMAQKGKKK